MHAPLADPAWGAKLGAILCELVWTAVDSTGTGSLLFRSVWTPLDTGGHGLEIHGSGGGVRVSPGAENGLANGHFWPLSRIPGLAADNRLITFHALGASARDRTSTFGAPRKGQVDGRRSQLPAA